MVVREDHLNLGVCQSWQAICRRINAGVTTRADVGRLLTNRSTLERAYALAAASTIVTVAGFTSGIHSTLLVEYTIVVHVAVVADVCSAYGGTNLLVGTLASSTATRIVCAQ
jgi:hypothetical protein